MSTITFSQIPMYSVKDKKADEFGPPYCAKNDKVAMRMFQQLLEKASPWAVMDYALYQIGYFDPVTGVVDALAVKEVSVPNEMIEKYKKELQAVDIINDPDVREKMKGGK